MFKKNQKNRFSRINNIRYTPYYFLAPSLILLVIFALLPLLGGIGLSFTEYPILKGPEFIGFSNFKEIFHDEVFKKSLINTLYYMVGTVPPRLVIGFIVAMLLNKAIRGKSILRAMYYFPVIAPLVSVSVLWQWMYHNHFGIINSFLRTLSLNPIPWLTDSKFAMPAIIIMSVWKTVGWNMVVFLAGLQGISPTYYEASRIEGANSWQNIKYITIPLMKPVILLALVMATIDSSKVFEQVYIMTGGGPGYSTMTLVQQVYNTAFQKYEMGYASAIAVILFIIISIFSFIQFKVLDSE